MSRGYDRRQVIKGIGAASVVGLAGCLGDDEEFEIDPADPDERDPLMHGVLLPTTGDLGDLGAPIRDAAILPEAQLEDEIDFEIDIREEDTQSDPEAGISAAQSLVDAGYPAVTGAASSEVSINVAEGVFVPDGIVACSPASTSPALTDIDDDDYFFRTAFSDALQSGVIAEVAYEDRGLETAASFHLNNEYGEALSEAFVEGYGDLGGEVTAEEAFEPEQPSYTSALESVLEDDPEALIVIGYPDSGEQIFRDFYEDIDSDTTIIVTDGLRDGSLPADVDNPMDNVIGTAPLADGPHADAFEEMYEEEYDTEPGVFNAQAYDATAALLLANAAAGENHGGTIRDALRAVTDEGGEEIGPDNLAEGFELLLDGEEIEYRGASSEVRFDENGDVEGAQYEIFGFSADGIETLDTVTFE